MGRVSRRYLLDTNILSDLVRNPSGCVAQRIAEVGEVAVCTSVIVAAELRFGACKRDSQRLTRQVETILGAMELVAWEEPADRCYATLRSRLEREGRPIGGNDMLIAAQALALGLTVVTHNSREFARIPALKLEDWLL